MKPPRFRCLAAILMIASGLSHGAETGGMSQRVVDYYIDVQLDQQTGLLDGIERITWRNLTEEPTSRLWFHLYHNAYQNDRTLYARESEGEMETAFRRESDWGWTRVVTVGPAEEPDSAFTWRFESPASAPEDRTVMVVDLRGEVAPGDSIVIQVEFLTQLPYAVTRSGRKGKFFLAAQWFPKLGVFQGGEWHCYPFHWNSEFFADFGSYRVDITVPFGFVVGATGAKIREQGLLPGTTTHFYTADDVHDFAWVASPHVRGYTRTFNYGDWPPVEIQLLLQPEHAWQADRHFKATEAALTGYGEWLGHYPYPVITLVDPPYHTELGGMEYPTFILIGTDLIVRSGDLSLEELIVHEFGHQYWYGMVASDEFEEPWLDEGLTTFSTGLLMSRWFDTGYYTRDLLGFPIYGVRLQWGENPLPFTWWGRTPLDWFGNYKIGYLRRPGTDRVAGRSWEFYDNQAYRVHVYDRPALALATLNNYPEPGTAEKVLAEFFKRYRFKHPRTEDFIAVAKEVAADDIGWLAEGILFGDGAIDYAITSIDNQKTLPGRGLFPQDTLLVYRDGKEGDPGPYRSRIRVERLGDVALPVEVEVGLKNGTVKLFRWNGEYRWRDFILSDNSPVAWARVDPGGKLAADLNRANNSLTTKARTTPVLRYSTQFLFWLQSMLAYLTLGLG